MIKQIIHDEKIFAIIIKKLFKRWCGIFYAGRFFSAASFYESQKGKIIDAHTHNIIPREVNYTKEVLVIRRGKLRVDFYEENHVYIESHEVEEGDVILLAYGGHGFEVLDDCEMIEIKQGPYLGDQDKIRFIGKRE